jgi:hypothetical protein
MTIHLHLVPKIKTELELYFHSYKLLYGIYRDKFTFNVFLKLFDKVKTKYTQFHVLNIIFNMALR